MIALRGGLFLLATRIAFQSGAFASGIVTFTGSDGALVRFDRESLELVQGMLGTNSTNGDHLAYDETGRLFGSHQRVLFELDAESLGIIRQKEAVGTVQGLAVHGGRIYTFTGRDGDLIAFDCDTLELVQGRIGPGATHGTFLTRDETGRLFGTHSSSQARRIVEIDPDSGAVINEREVGNSLSGFAAFGGVLVAFTGLDGDMISFDADTLETLVGEEIGAQATNHLELAFDNTGRLFGNRKGSLVEIDPETLAVIGSRPQSGSMVSMAAHAPAPPGNAIAPISSLARVDGRLRLTIPPTFRRRMGIEYSPDLRPRSWIELGNFGEEAGNPDLVFIDPDPTRTGRAGGYYRAFLRPFIP